ncbi:hypothetical protein GE278_20180 [Enterobacteriaceae bacterium Kacie_13]|nr:hypothetical protein GE278_20180 [Enterobacteriaceae bacterium Kacie_13]
MASHQGQTGPHECTTLLTLLPVLFSQPGAGFFLSFFRHTSGWQCVGCVRSPRSHNAVVCS